ncbi:GerAB/ArcD/ProY family transporter [Priestia abyssalis]|uniref:GerAB/ArcD/ProY family transporter n=1 Tax=Priestia abyssalis TaxID=1221450 RepID=UPI0009950F98|nr:GerAB/ArcD/ProY family transporter [Priestia abyssalis]
MSNQVKPSFQVNSFLLFFLIHSSQVGVGILLFQRSIVKEAGYDSWIGIVLAGLMAHLSLFFMFRMLKYEHQDISQVHQFVYGKWLGRLFTSLFIIEFTWSGLAILRDYVRLLQIWIFPDLPTWIPTCLILALLYYTIAGGFRVMAGMSFFKVMFTFAIILPMFFTLGYAHFGNLSLIPTHTMKELWDATTSMSFSYAGFETILVYYPFIKEGQKSKSYAYLGNAATTLLYLLTAFMCFIFYSEKQLTTLIWPYLTMASNLEFSTIQRLETIFVSTWVLVIAPAVIQHLWCASRLTKNMFKVKQKYPLIFFMIIIVVMSNIIDDSQEWDLIRDWNGKIAFYQNYVYIPVLFFGYLLMRKVKHTSPSS